jgi:hypothetical protein
MSYSAFCAWGPGFTELLAPYNPDQRFAITGNHVVTCRRPENEADRGAVGFFCKKVTIS